MKLVKTILVIALIIAAIVFKSVPALLLITAVLAWKLLKNTAKLVAWGLIIIVGVHYIVTNGLLWF